MVGMIFQTLVGLFTAETSPKQLVGPVGLRSCLVAPPNWGSWHC